MKKHDILRSAAGLLAAALLFTGCQGAAASSGESAGSQAASELLGDNTAEGVEMPDYSVGLGDDGRYEGITALDHVTLPDYAVIPTGEEFTTVTDEDLQAALDEILSRFATASKITDRAVEDGDLVNIDYVGTIDGVPFDGGDSKGVGYDYTAGSSELIDDFLTQIIGAMPGDTVNVEVTFPEDYGVEELNGKDAVFATTIHYIHGEAELPELTDEFVQASLAIYGYTDAADLRAQVTEGILAEQRYNYVLDWMFKNCTFGEVPSQLVEDQLNILELELNNAAVQYGITVEELAQQYGEESLEVLVESYRPVLEHLVKQNLMSQAVAEDLELVVDESAVNDYFAELGVTDPSAYVESYGKGYVYQGVMNELVAAALIERVEG